MSYANNVETLLSATISQGEHCFQEYIGMGLLIDAVYENGAFRPLALGDLRLAEGQRVRLIVKASIEENEDVLSLAAKVYEGL